jgi:hypothetical protein
MSVHVLPSTGVADGADELDRVAHLARNAPGQAKHATHRFQRQTGRIVLAASNFLTLGDI